jgi:hypothetical protein
MGGANAFYRGTGACGPLSGGYSGGCQDDLRMPKRMKDHQRGKKPQINSLTNSSKQKVFSQNNSHEIVTANKSAETDKNKKSSLTQ